METKTDYSGSSNTYDWRAPSYPQQGWECPRCGKINAPWISQCNCPRNNWTISWGAGNTTGNPLPDIPCVTTSVTRAENVPSTPTITTVEAAEQAMGIKNKYLKK